jgi:hypothetical protein
MAFDLNSRRRILLDPKAPAVTKYSVAGDGDVFFRLGSKGAFLRKIHRAARSEGAVLLFFLLKEIRHQCSRTFWVSGCGSVARCRLLPVAVCVSDVRHRYQMAAQRASVPAQPGRKSFCNSAVRGVPCFFQR